MAWGYGGYPAGYAGWGWGSDWGPGYASWGWGGTTASQGNVGVSKQPRGARVTAKTGGMGATQAGPTPGQPPAQGTSLKASPGGTGSSK